jgi:flagellar biosynthesis/type III secretory pathway protein FliH
VNAPRPGLAWLEKSDTEVREPTWSAGTSRAHGGSSGPPANDVAAPAEGEPAPASAVVAEREGREVAERALAETEGALARARAETDEARAVLVKMRAELDEASSVMCRLATSMRDDAEGELVKLALAIAERVVARELESAPELVVIWAREAIAGSALGEHLEIALSTQLSSALADADWAELGPFVSTDPALSDGTCEVRDGGKVVTVDAETRLGLVAEHLETVTDREAA